jgi:phosphohistidine phosphatase
MSGKTPSWNIRKGAVWWFTHKNKGGDEEIFLHAAISPDMV